MKRAILLFAGLMLLAGGSAAIALAIRIQKERAAREASQPVLPIKPPAGADVLREYTLTERSGAKFDSKSLAGKVHVVNFFFATCPARCPLQTKHIAQLQTLLREKGIAADRAMLVSITVDPKQDTPAALREYAAKYKADPKQWVFLTGDDVDYLTRVAGEIYQVPYKVSTHVERIFLVDKWGRIRGNYRWYDPTDFAILQSEMLKLLDEKEPPELPKPAHEPVPGEEEALEMMKEEQAAQKQKAD